MLNIEENLHRAHSNECIDYIDKVNLYSDLNDICAQNRHALHLYPGEPLSSWGSQPKNSTKEECVPVLWMERLRSISRCSRRARISIVVIAILEI